MNIKKLTITKQEICQAVQAFLKTKGIDLPVENVEKEYSYSRDYDVEFKKEEESAPAAPPAPAEVVAIEPVATQQ